MFWRKILLGALIAFNLFLVYRLLFSSAGYWQYSEQADNILTLKADIERLEQENLQLSNQVRLLRSDQDYLEKMIRDQMKFVKSNEILYVFPDGSKPEAQVDPSISNGTLKRDEQEVSSQDEPAGARPNEGKN